MWGRMTTKGALLTLTSSQVLVRKLPGKSGGGIICSIPRALWICCLWRLQVLLLVLTLVLHWLLRTTRLLVLIIGKVSGTTVLRRVWALQLAAQVVIVHLTSLRVREDWLREGGRGGGINTLVRGGIGAICGEAVLSPILASTEVEMQPIRVHGS